MADGNRSAEAGLLIGALAAGGLVAATAIKATEHDARSNSQEAKAASILDQHNQELPEGVKIYENIITRQAGATYYEQIENERKGVPIPVYDGFSGRQIGTIPPGTGIKNVLYYEKHPVTGSDQTPVGIFDFGQVANVITGVDGKPVEKPGLELATIPGKFLQNNKAAKK